MTRALSAGSAFQAIEQIEGVKSAQEVADKECIQR
jgi:hypothetical protein